MYSGERERKGFSDTIVYQSITQPEGLQVGLLNGQNLIIERTKSFQALKCFPASLSEAIYELYHSSYITAKVGRDLRSVARAVLTDQVGIGGETAEALALQVSLRDPGADKHLEYWHALAILGSLRWGLRYSCRDQPRILFTSPSEDELRSAQKNVNDIEMFY